MKDQYYLFYEIYIYSINIYSGDIAIITVILPALENNTVLYDGK